MAEGRASREEEERASEGGRRSIRGRLDREVASASQPRYVRRPLIWDLGRGRRIRQLPGHSDSSVPASPSVSALTASFASSSRPRRHLPHPPLCSSPQPPPPPPCPPPPPPPRPPVPRDHKRPSRQRTISCVAGYTLSGQHILPVRLYCRARSWLPQRTSPPPLLHAALGRSCLPRSPSLFSASAASHTAPWLPPATVHTLSTSSVPLLAHSPAHSRCHFSFSLPVPGLSPPLGLPFWP